MIYLLLRLLIVGQICCDLILVAGTTTTSSSIIDEQQLVFHNRQRLLRGSSSPSHDDASNADSRVVGVAPFPITMSRHLLQTATESATETTADDITATDVSSLFEQDEQNNDIILSSSEEEEEEEEKGALTADNFNIDLDTTINNAADDNEDYVDEYNKEVDNNNSNNKDRITIVHDNYKPNKPYRPPKEYR
jgi:hypothetical protein